MANRSITNFAKKIKIFATNRLEINMNDFKTFVEEVKLIKHYRTKCAKIRRKYPFATIEKWLEKHRKLEKIYLTKEEFESRNEL